MNLAPREIYLLSRWADAMESEWGDFDENGEEAALARKIRRAVKGVKSRWKTPV